MLINYSKTEVAREMTAARYQAQVHHCWPPKHNK